MVKPGQILRAAVRDVTDHTVDIADEPASSAGRVMAAYHAIRSAIRENVFPPGYQAAEIEIARQLGMSRTPVHEAMARLQEDGLVRILPKKGIIICALSPVDIEEIYEVTIALEGAAAARLSTLDADTKRDVIAQLRHATEDMMTALANNDLSTWATADERFHETLIVRSGNSRLTRMASTVADQLHRARMFTLNLRPLPTSSSDEHFAIIDAIEGGDEIMASRAARMHRKHAHDQLVPLIAKLNLQNL
ncbi:GntR family transcriptional regulator [Agrobacterium rosae]|uniref:GntR family transcriptional regulator n=1 Tax=Agrobacterium rosae TaxID=1972867 RepID=UPI002034A5E1|nr:GntR family transcriptional regulator [Agrobacterium rosae]MCM2435939.1 GntR family transcriptional regulator [Agrobacterium rosae]